MLRRILLSSALCACGLLSAQVNITVDNKPTGVSISPTLYGIFYEDINHAADGGLYAELIRNRSFEDAANATDGWEPYLSVSGKVDMSIETKGLLNDVQKQCLHVITRNVGDTDAGVSNSGFWGIDAVKGREYKLSLWIKVNKGSEFYVMLKGKTGTHLYASARLPVDRSRSGWQHVTTTLTAKENHTDAIFVITSKGNSDFYLDMVSLFPPTYKGRENGLRPDLAEMLYELHPAFMRFPGGCFVEGQDSPDNAFRWQRTIGPIEERQGHENKNWGYTTSDGLGFHEYLQLAEDLNAKPLYVCNIGIWHGDVTPVDNLQMWIDECLSAIEYANGDVKTKYGALRAKNGHPQPFNLEYIEIGNENNQDDGTQLSDHYYERYRLFRDAILKKYPTMKIIGNVAAWGTDEPRWHSEDKVDFVDEHYYRNPAWFASHFEKYDAYERTQPAVYCGEYAVTESAGKYGNLNAALGEAVYMMGMENNGDIVKMSSYAPIFVNNNDNRWQIDMIRFDNHTAMGTPSYYVQKMMADNVGTKVLNISEGKQTLFPETALLSPDISYVGVATYNTQATFDNITVTGENKSVRADGKNKDDFLLRSTTWEFDKDGLTQTADGEGVTALMRSAIGGRKYTLSTRARKNSGDEGFLLVFNFEDKDNYCWLNIGGWNNTAHGIEQVCGGGGMTIKSVPGSIETGRWYDIRLDVDGNNLTAYLDDKLILEATLTSPVLAGIFASAAEGKNEDEMIVKIVNTSKHAETATLSLGSFDANGGELIQLKAADGAAENTLENPTNVYPTTRHISLQGKAPQFTIPPYSLNILRLKRR